MKSEWSFSHLVKNLGIIEWSPMLIMGVQLSRMCVCVCVMCLYDRIIEYFFTLDESVGGITQSGGNRANVCEVLK